MTQMEHETKREWFNKIYPIGKVLYLLGCLKLVERYSSSDKWHYGEKFRLLNPFTWLFIIIALFIAGFNKETFRELKQESVLW